MKAILPLRGDGLYAILDVDAWRRRGVELSNTGVLESIAQALLDAAPAALQLRAKNEGGAVTLALLRRLRPLTTSARVPLVVNDRVDLALLCTADMVHIGQEDLPFEEVRRIAPSLGVGVSTHDFAQLEAALRIPTLSYVAFGPVFGTQSKASPDVVVGVDRLQEACTRASALGVPLVAIGGIDSERVGLVARSGARLAAVISELVVASDGRADLDEITRRARALDRTLRGSP